MMTQINYNGCNIFSSILCYCIVLLLISGIPILDLTFALLYNNHNVTCNSSVLRILGINIIIWLIVKSLLIIVTLLLLVIILILGKNSSYNCCFSCIYIIIGIFYVSWLITGSIIFWRDCSNLEPFILNIFMWFSLIIGYLYIVLYIRNDT